MFEKNRLGNTYGATSPLEDISKQRYKDKSTIERTIDLIDQSESYDAEINLRQKNSIGPFLQNSNFNITKLSNPSINPGFKLPI